MPTKKGHRQLRSKSRSRNFSRETDLSRSIDIRDEYRSVLILTNGESTEIAYFNGMRAEPWITVGKVIVKYENGDPGAVIRKAAAMRGSNDYDEAWAVCDVDEYEVRDAISQATEYDVGLTLSVPCFEVWLILHRSARCPGFNNCEQADRFLAKVLPGWDKASLRYSDFRAGVLDAIARAKQRDNPPEGNPSTAVWKLVLSLGAEALQSPNTPA